MQGNDFGDGNVSISHEQLLALAYFVQISAELVLKCRDIHAAHGVASDVAIIATLSSVVNDLEQREWGTSRGAVASSLETVLIQQQAQWEPVAEYTRSDFCCWTPHGP